MQGPNMPAWVSNNLRSTKSRKVFVRCWLASWIAFILILPNKSLVTLGNGAFFTVLASMFLPPNMPVQLFVLGISTLLLGLCTGWAIGAAAMKAALSARDQLLLKSTLLQAQQIAATSVNPDAEFRAEIFQGVFLDTASSIVFGVFLAFGTFCFALMRAYLPKLVIASVFGTVAVDVFCSYGPLFPFAEYTIMNSIAISASCYAAIGIILIILVFPESINHAHLDGISSLCGQIKGTLLLHGEILEAGPTALAKGGPLLGKLAGARAGLVGAWKQQQASAAFINLEFSWGKWSGDDVLELEQKLLGVISRLANLHNWASILSGAYGLSHPGQASLTPSTTNSGPSPPKVDEGASTDSDTFILQQLYTQQRALEHKHSLRLEDVVPRIADASADLRAAAAESLAVAQGVIDGTNQRRWRRGPAEVDERVKALDAAIARLRTELDAFREQKRHAVLEPYEALLGSDGEGPGSGALPYRSLHISFVFVSSLIVTAEAVLAFVTGLRTTVDKRRKTRLWAPKGLRALGKALRSRGGEQEAAGEDAIPEQPGKEQKVEKGYMLDPDSKPPTNLFQRIMNGIHALYSWSKTPEALFTFKYTFVSVALWLPSVFKSSAAFNYEQKGLWALIMAQTTLNIYASDQIFSLIFRCLGTFVGAVMGLLVWYLGNAKSNGTPYGSAAALGVFLVPAVFLRLFAPPQYLMSVLMGCVTMVLVVGYSWIDAKLPTFGNPGIGWPIAWKRLVLVLIGCFAGFIMMCLPPKSGRKAVRLRNATTITRISQIYAFVTSKWISSPAKQNGVSKEGAKTSDDWREDFRNEFRGQIVGLWEELAALKQQTAIARFEGSIRGAWPIEEYNRLVDVQTEMVAAMAQLGSALLHVSDSVRLGFLHQSKVVNPNFVSDVMATFTVVGQSLRTGEPLHEVLNTKLLERVFYHSSLAEAPNRAQENGKGGGLTPAPSLEELRSLDYAFYATSLVAVFQLIGGLDELRQIVGRLCGVVPLEGFHQWRMEFDRVHVSV